MAKEVEAEVVVTESLDHRAAPGMSRRDVADAQIANLRDGLYEDTVFNLRAILKWSEVSPDQDSPRPEWVEEFGRERAEQMLRIAKNAHLPTRDAPAGLKMSVDLFRGLEAARATDKLTRSSVAVQVIVGAPPPPPMTMLVDGKDKG